MKTIEEIALGTKFSENQISAIMEICWATQNSTLAMNILLGIYEEPKIMNMGLTKVNKDSEDRLMVFESYDKWADRVFYSYEKKKTKEIRVHKSTDTTLINIDNYEMFVVSYEDDYKWFNFELGEVIKATDDCSLSQWNTWSEAYGKMSDGE
jgi:hypothetical protein